LLIELNISTLSAVSIQYHVTEMISDCNADTAEFKTC